LNGIPTPSPNYISILVLNHTDEPIGFENIGFNIKVFQYNSETNMWEKVLLPYTPEKTQTILPPKLEKFDFEILNSWELRDGD